MLVQGPCIPSRAGAPHADLSPHAACVCIGWRFQGASYIDSTDWLLYEYIRLLQVEYLEELVQKGLEIYAAYGNTATDIQAYENVGIPKERTFIVGPHGGELGSVKIDYQSHNPSIFDHPDSEVPIPYTTLSWGPSFLGEDDTHQSRKLGMIKSPRSKRDQLLRATRAQYRGTESGNTQEALPKEPAPKDVMTVV